ncbi:MarR family transcriptional regulator [Kitasatospora sp. NPDC001539]|uniref:MarR family winged helix-turn-helix transcriptional regulator n=1 Tax=Kitasatospora sp. NPDC001539 TaxID=3154384 RepID=UPI00331D8F98
MQADENWFHPSTSGGFDEAAAGEVPQAVAALVSLWRSALDRTAPQLSAYQFRALEAVEREEGLNLTGLAGMLEVGTPACSRLCGRLEAAGLLERRAHPRRRREVVLAVTPEGRRTVREVTARRRDDLAAVFARLTPEDRAALVHGLRALFAVVAERPRQESGGNGF